MNIKEYFKTSEAQFLVIFLLGLCLVLLTSLRIQIGWVSLNLEFGLLQMLPLSFWIGFAVMLFSCIVCVNSDSGKVFFAKSFLLFLIAWALPVFFESTTSTMDSFFHFSTALFSANYNYSNTMESASYLAWPGLFIYGKSAYDLTGLDVFDFTKYYRLFSASFTFLAFFIFLKKILPKNNRIGLVIFTFIPVWMNQFHFSPQSMGFTFFLLILSILFFKRVAFWLVGFLMAVWILISHPTTMLFILPLFVLWSLFDLFYWFILVERNPQKFFSNPLLAVLILFVLLGATFFLNSYISGLVTISPVKDNNTMAQQSIQTKQLNKNIIDIVISHISNETNPIFNLRGIGAIYFKEVIDKKLGINSQLMVLSDENGTLPAPQLKIVSKQDEQIVIEKARTDSNFASAVLVSPVLTLGPKIRTFCFFGLLFLSILFFLCWPRVKEKQEKNRYFFVLTGFLVAILMVQFGPTIAPTVFQVIDRVILYSAIFSTLMVLFALNYYSQKTKTVLVAALLTLALLNFSSAYFNESANVTGAQTKSVNLFLKDHASSDAKIWASAFPFVQYSKDQTFRGRGIANSWDYASIDKSWENWAIFSDYDLQWDRRWGPFYLNQTRRNQSFALTTNKILETGRLQLFQFGRPIKSTEVTPQ